MSYLEKYPSNNDQVKKTKITEIISPVKFLEPIQEKILVENRPNMSQTIGIPKTKLIFILLTIFYTFECFGHQLNSFKDGTSSRKPALDFTKCSSVDGFTKELQEEIRSKAPQVNRIIDLVLGGDERRSTYDELATLCDTFGPRLSGSESLNKAIDYMTKKMHDSKLKVHPEKAMIPKWEVGDQWAELVIPGLRKQRMTILALGTSVGTGNNTIEAEVQLVQSFDQLDQLGKEGKLFNKIVVYNYNFTAYPVSVKFRTEGASRAAKYGALAALVRSVTNFSLYTPHTGSGSQSIPTAAITVEDAELIQRWVNRKQRLVIRLYIDARNYDPVESVNVIGDIVGNTNPDEVVVVSGHIDSWYNTEGAVDDGGGLMISYKALDILNKLNLTAKRTIRAILWTSEEFGLYGARQYFEDHKHDLDKFKLVMESDLGTFKPLGLSFKNLNPLSQCIVNDVLKLTDAIGTTSLDSNFEGSDIEVFTIQGTPGLSLKNENSKYFYYHHTSADSMTAQDPDHLDKSTILWASAAYVLADLSVPLSNR